VALRVQVYGGNRVIRQPNVSLPHLVHLVQQLAYLLLSRNWRRELKPLIIFTLHIARVKIDTLPSTHVQPICFLIRFFLKIRLLPYLLLKQRLDSSRLRNRVPVWLCRRIQVHFDLKFGIARIGFDLGQGGRHRNVERFVGGFLSAQKVMDYLT